MTISIVKSTLSKTVIVLGVVSFFTDFSSEMIYPLLPIFLTEMIGASTVALGLIEGIAEATASIGKIVSGVLADKAQRRKPFIVFGYTLAGIIRPLIALANSWPAILGIRFLDRVGKGLRSAPRDAMIADSTLPESRGAAYGFHRAMDHAGAVVGPLAASLLLGLLHFQLRTVFLIASVPALIGVGFLVFGLKETAPTKSQTQNIFPSNIAIFQNFKSLGSGLQGILLSLFIFTLGNSTDAFLLVRLSQSGVQESWIAGIWSIHHIVKMIANIYGGKASDLFSKKYLIIFGWSFYALIYFAFAVSSNGNLLIIIFLLYGIYYGIVEPAEKALIAEIVSEKLRGTAFGLYHLVIGLGALPASLLFGFVWKNWGVTTAFSVGAIFALISAAVLFFTKPELLKNPKQLE